MSSKRSHWQTYNEEMSGFDYGHALWEPAPLSYFKRIQLGDVGYIHTGRFRLLFSAGCPLGNRQLGADVPLTFKPLDIGGIDDREPLAPGCYSTDDVRATPVYPTSSSPPQSGSQPPASPPMFESFSKISFQLTGGQGAALVTRYPIYREDTLRGNRGSTFEKYTKEHYASWVEFARETEHGDVNPVLVTGVDRTRDFAMLCYSTDSDMSCEFATSTPGVSSGWGTWHKTGPVYTNHGPQLRCPPSSIPTTGLISSGTSHTEPVSGEYNQCVFIRYYTVRKRLGVPKVVKAGAGPHDLGGGGREDGRSPGTHCDPDPDYDSGSDIASSLLSDGDGSSVTSIETESDIVVHNTVTNERDEFDMIADYVFQNSDAQLVLLHHQDTVQLQTFGGSTDLSTRLLEVQPAIIVDGNGVGTIEFRAEASPGVRPDCSPRIISITLSCIPDGMNDEEVATSEGGELSQVITVPTITTNTPKCPTLDLARPLPGVSQYLCFSTEEDANPMEGGVFFSVAPSTSPASQHPATSRKLSGISEDQWMVAHHEKTTIDPEAYAQTKSYSYFARLEATADARARFYNEFQHEVDKCERDFLRKCGADLNTALIFAGLFFAITSAFIFAVQTQLQPDYNQWNYDILWPFADSAGLGFTGRIPAKSSSDSPWTGPDHTLVHVQVILFSSLSASLFAALVAMLGKQWLNRYSRICLRESLVDRCRDRQHNMDRMHTWGFLLVMESLPLILQAALLLLGCALSRYLFTINNLIAWVVLGFTAAGSLFYALIVVAAIASYNSPFRTPLPLIIRSIINLGRKRTKYLRKSRRRFGRIFLKRIARLRQQSGRPTSTLDGNDTGNYFEVPMAGPSDRPLALFDEDTNREGYVLDANCIAWMFEMTMNADVTFDVMKFIPEVVWHRDIHDTPLEKLYGAVLECFDQSSGRPVMISKFKNKAYLAAKALAHVAIQRKCMGAESEKALFDSISEKHKINWSLSCGEDHDLESTFGMIDLVFGPGNPTPMRWHEFSFSDSHHTWMNRILLYRAWDAFNRDEPLPDDVKEFALQYLRTKKPPPATTVMGYLRLISLFLGITPDADDQQPTDKRPKFRTQIDRIYNKLDETFLNPDITVHGISRTIEAMILIAPLSEDITARSYNLFRIIMGAHISRTYPREKWEASRLALKGAYGWSRVFLAVGNPEDILTFLEHHFDLATKHHENHDEPIENALYALSSTNDPVTTQALSNFDPTHPSFIHGISHIFQPRKPLRLRRAALFFLPRIAHRWFKIPPPVMGINEIKDFSANWAATVDKIGRTEDVRTPALVVLFNMINSRHWRPHIVANKWKLLEYALSYPDDSHHFERCLENPEVVDAISTGENPEVVVLWSEILLLRYRRLKPEVLERFVVSMKSATGKELEEYMSAVQSKQEEAEGELAGFTMWSADPRAVALREEVHSHKDAVKFLKSLRVNSR